MAFMRIVRFVWRQQAWFVAPALDLLMVEKKSAGKEVGKSTVPAEWTRSQRIATMQP
jgi:hypothetical protein